MRRRFSIAACCGLLLIAPALVGQQPVGFAGRSADLLDYAMLSRRSTAESVLFRRFSETVEHLVEERKLTSLPAVAHGSYNSGWADDRDNGALWAGRGSSGLLRAGVAARWRGISAAFVPEIAWWQNDAYRTRGNTGGHPFYSLDLPQRLGTSAGSEISFGQSFVQVQGWSVAAGLSNENLWSGPANRYPILHGASAPGYPHLFAGSQRPLDLRIALVEVRAVLGWTQESAAFDPEPDNDFASLFGWGVALRPRGIEWLEVGVQRILIFPVASRFTIDSDNIIGFVAPSDTNRVGSELAGIYGRVRLPESGFELYGEWAREDRFATWLEDFFPEPDHSQGFMLGVRKIFPLDHGSVALHGELVDLQEQSERREGAGRPLPVFYAHGEPPKGYTHRGQILGASVGPGADAQFVGLDWLSTGPLRLVGAFVERVRRNDTAFEQREAFPYRHDVELIGGLRGLGQWRDFSVDGQVSVARRHNRLFLEPLDHNVKVDLVLTWWPSDRSNETR